MWFRYSERKTVELFVNSKDPDQTPRSAASDLGLHCLLITRLGVFRLQLVKCLRRQLHRVWGSSYRRAIKKRAYLLILKYGDSMILKDQKI